jgi:hypothetical protein
MNDVELEYYQHVWRELGIDCQHWVRLQRNPTLPEIVNTWAHIISDDESKPIFFYTKIDTFKIGDLMANVYRIFQDYPLCMMYFSCLHGKKTKYTN